MTIGVPVPVVVRVRVRVRDFFAAHARHIFVSIATILTSSALLCDATHVEQRAALHRGAARDGVVARAVGLGRLACALGDVQRDR